MLIHILQHVLDANLLAVADAPDTVELKSLADGTLEDEYRRGTRATDEIDTLRVQMGDGQREDTVMMAVEQSDAVRPYQGSAILLAGVEDALFEQGALLRLLTESGRDDDKGAHPLLGTEVIDIVRAEPGGHHQYGQISLGNLLHVVESLDALYIVLLGIHDMQGTAEASTDNIANDRSAWLVHIVRAADDHNAPGL